MTSIERLSYEEYCKRPGIRQSRLTLMGRSPAHFKAAENEDSAPTRDTILGHIFHTAVLEPARLETSYYVRPDTYTLVGAGKPERKKWNGNSLWCKEWLEAHKNREILLSGEQKAIIAMRKCVLEHPYARLALANGESEVCLFALHEESGIQLKCRCDRLTSDAIVDLKTTDDASPRAFGKSLLKWSYHVQAAFYLDLARFVGLDVKYFVFVAVEKSPPYAVAVYFIDDRSLEKGRELYQRWLALLAHCMEYDEWPGYDTGIQSISLPNWAFKPEPLLLTE